MTITFLVFVVPFAPLATLMHGHDSSVTAIGHYFAGSSVFSTILTLQ